MGLAVGVIYFKLKPHSFSFSTFGYQYFKLITIFNGKYELFEPKKCPYNPEVVGSSPASATKEPSKSKDLDGFSYAFRTLQMDLLTRFEHMCFGVANWL